LRCPPRPLLFPYTTLFRSVHGVRHEKRLDAHVHEAVDAAWRIVGVQGRQHEVAGEGGLDGNRGRLAIPDLAHQDHVRVLSQERSDRKSTRLNSSHVKISYA